MTRSLSAQDLEQLDDLEISEAEVQRQLELFRRPPSAARLLGPCTLGDGIVRLTETDQDRFIDRWQTILSITILPSHPIFFGSERWK